VDPAKQSGLNYGLSTVADIVAELEAVYRRRYRAFCRAMAAVLGDANAAHDLVQEGFARALRYQSSFQGGSLEAWVWRIMMRESLGFATPRDSVAGAPALAEGSAEAAGADPDVAAALRQLPERQRLMVFLRYYADLEYADIAIACDVAVGTVSATLAQARAALAAALTTTEDVR
jgi:RNA polymerase sigma factor (sigma-70 family)